MKTLKTSLWLCLAAAAALAAEPAVISKETTGQAAVQLGDEAKALDAATKDALRTAVEQAAGVLITSDTVTLNSQLVRDQVYAHASGYVKKFEVGKPKIEKGILTVTVKSEIGTADLDKDLQAVKGLIASLNHTRVLVVTQEQSIDSKGIAQRSEMLSSRVVDAFRKDGWKIVDEKGTGVAGAMKLSSGVGSQNLDAKEIAAKTDADYIVYGTVNLRYLPPSEHSLVPEVDANGKQQLFMVVGDYDLSMFETRTGRNLGKVANRMSFKVVANVAKLSKSYEESAIVLCIDEAPRITSELRAPVIEYLRNRAVNGYEIAVHVKGISDLAAQQEFRKALEALKDVKEVKNRALANGNAEFDVSFLGTAEAFGDAIGAATFKKKKLQVVGLQNNVIEVAIGK